MGTLQEWAGDALEISSATSLTLGSRIRVHRVTMTAGSQAVRMPDARKLRTVGGAVLIVWNTGSNSYALHDNGGNVIEAALAQNEMAYLYLLSQADADGDWRAQIEATDVVPAPPVNDFFYTIGGQDPPMQKTPAKYDHVGNSWAAQTAGSNVHSQAASSNLSGRGYAHGSTGATGTGDLNDEYDPDVWTSKTACNLAESNAFRAAAADAGLTEIYGRAVTSATRHDQYNVTGDTWGTRTAFPVNHKAGHAEAPQTGLVYIYGGVETFGGFDNGTLSNREHTTAGDSFASLTDLPTQQRKLHAGFILGANPFAVCGTEDNNGPQLDRCDEYIVSGDSWTARTVYSRGATEDIAGAARASGTGYVIGGNAVKTGASYQVDTWTSIADHSTSSSAARGAQNLGQPLTT